MKSSSRLAAGCPSYRRPFKKTGTRRAGRCRHSLNHCCSQLIANEKSIFGLNRTNPCATFYFGLVLCFKENGYFKEASGFVSEKSAKVHET
jgi:hypothetical protein